MKLLLWSGITSVAFIGMLFCTEIVDATGQDVITSTVHPVLDIVTQSDRTSIKVYNNNCECVKYDCGCCQHLEWDAISINGTLCANASYLERDYGISLTVTYNNFAILNETISARNPPPICFGEDLIDAMDVEICLHIYDINIDDHKFHACFEISGRLMKVTVAKIRLGCIDERINLRNKVGHMETNFLLFLQKMKNAGNTTTYSVIMV